MAVRAGPQRPRAFWGVVPTMAAASWRYDTQVVPAMDELVLVAESVTAEMSQQPTFWDHPYATIYQQQRQGGGGRM